MLALNVRNPHDFRGDLAAMIGAAHLGERRMQKLFTELGAPTVEAAIEAVLDAAEAQARAVVATWKDGVFLAKPSSTTTAAATTTSGSPRKSPSAAATSRSISRRAIRR